MSRRLAPKLGEPSTEPTGPEFCNEGSCFQFAQSSDPTCANTLKFKCPGHEAAARARGETGIRKKISTGNEYTNVDEGSRTIRNAEIAEQLAAGTIPRDGSGKKARKSRESSPRAVPPPRPIFQVSLDGQVIEQHPSAQIAMEKLHGRTGSLRVAMSKGERYKGFRWFYELPAVMPVLPTKGRKLKAGRAVEEVDPAGNVLARFDSVLACETANSFGRSTLNYVLLQRSGFYKGRRFRFAPPTLSPPYAPVPRIPAVGVAGGHD